MSRSFSTTVRNLLQFIWKGTDAVQKYEDQIKDKLAKNSKLKDADKVEIAGQEHNSSKDKANRVSGQVFKDETRLTSLHAYNDGRVVYSKGEYNDAQEEGSSEV